MPSLRLLCLVGLLLGLAAPSVAQTVNDAFTVRGIEVDVSAANAQAAKEKAVADGQRQAFRQLLERLTSSADLARLPNADGLQYVRDFTVDQERSSTTRYLATLSVRFNATAVKRLLQGAGLSFAEARSKAIVIVPVYKSAPGAKAVLWDDPNPWRLAWSSSGGGGLVPLVVPVGDLADAQAISVEQALAAQPEPLRAIGMRWQTSDVIIAAAAVSPNGRAIDVMLMAPPGTPKPFDTKSYGVNAGDDVDAVLRQAARDISRAIDTAYKQPNLLDFGQSGTLPALVPLTGLNDWLAVRERLARVGQVRRWELVSLSRVEAALVLHVVGDVTQVRTALAGAGLTLTQVDGLWSLRPQSVPQ